MLQIRASAADGTQSRMLTSTFTTTTTPPVVPEATVALIASESSRCAAMGGSFYTSPSVRGQVTVPAGSEFKFDGCYHVTNSSCIGSSPVSGNQVFKCTDDITNLLHSVAPGRRGPVISSMEGTTGGIAPAFVPSPVVEPIRWCAEQPNECIEVIQTAAEAGEVVAEAVGAEAVASFLIVAAEAIGLGLALGVLLAILFPTELTIGSMFEYPINFNTDFDTFGNWGGDHGEWYNSLKMYAEVIKTTKQLTAEHTLPFAWGGGHDQILKGLIDQACAVQQGHTAPPARGCGDDVVVYVPGAKNFRFRPMPETGQHIVDAMNTGLGNDPRRAAWYYPAYSPGGKLASDPPNNYSRTWYYTAPFKPNACDDLHVKGDGKTCDEFPFFTTNQAVDLTLPDKSLRADVRLTPTEEGGFQGNDLSTLYRQCLDNTDGKHFIVLPVPSWVAAGGPSFGFQVNQGGASLCMKPQPPVTTDARTTLSSLTVLSFAIGTPFQWRRQIPLFRFDPYVYTFVLDGDHEGEIWRYLISPDLYDPVRAAPSLAALFAAWTDGIAAGVVYRREGDDWLMVGEPTETARPFDVLRERAPHLDFLAFPIDIPASAMRERQSEYGVDLDCIDRGPECQAEQQDAVDAVCASLGV